MRTPLLLSLLLGACAGDVSYDDDALDLTGQEQAVASSEQGEGGHYRYVRYDTSTPAKATGAALVPLRDANGNLETSDNGVPLRATCGVTFISPHFAVTAAHCMREARIPNPAVDRVTVEQYTVNATELVLAFPALIQGRFPNYTRPYPLTTQLGYHVTTHQCELRSRCDNDYGRFACGDTLDADVALLYCGTRARDSAWLPVAAADTEAGPVEMYWPHEVLSVPDARPVMPGEGAPPDVVTRYFDALDRYDHYTRYTSRKDNYHYFGAGKNQLLPLRSQPWPDGTPRTRLGQRWGYTATDLFGCHGTSGSGVLEVQSDGTYALLGPMAVANDDWGGRLCTDPADFQKGQPNLMYTKNEQVRAMVSRFSKAIMFDRIKLPWQAVEGDLEASKAKTP